MEDTRSVIELRTKSDDNADSGPLIQQMSMSVSESAREKEKEFKTRLYTYRHMSQRHVNAVSTSHQRQVYATTALPWEIRSRRCQHRCQQSLYSASGNVSIVP